MGSNTSKNTTQDSEFRNAGQYVEIHRAPDQSLNSNPQDAIALNEKGLVYKAQGKWNEALSCFERARQADPTKKEYWANEGEALLRLDRYADAHQPLDQALQLDEQYGHALTMKGIAYLAEKKWREALACFEKARQAEPTTKEYWANEGQALLRLGRYADAHQALDQALQLDRQYGRALYIKGMVYGSEDKWNEALSCLETARQEVPTEKQYWASEGEALWRLNRWADAYQAVDQALQQDPQYAEALRVKGVVCKAQGKWNEALSCFERARQAEPSDEVNWAYEGEALLRLGRYADAHQALDQALQLDSQYGRALHIKGMVYGTEDKWDEALPCFERARQAEPTEKEYWAYEGEALRLLGRYADAHRALDQALLQDPHYASALNLKGLVYEAEGKWNEALSYYERARQANPTAKEYWTNEGEALLQMDRYADAHRALDQALQLNQQDTRALEIKELMSKAEKELNETQQVVSKEKPEDLEQQAFEQIQAEMSYATDNQKIQEWQDKIWQDIKDYEQQLKDNLQILDGQLNQVRSEYGPVYQEYLEKRMKLEEQIALQKPEEVRMFYNTIQKLFGAKLISALILIGEMIKREDTKAEKTANIAANVASGILGSLPIPVVSGVVGNLAGVAIQEGVSAIKDRNKMEEYENINKTTSGFKEALQLTERVARKLARHYAEYIKNHKLSFEQAENKASEMVNAMYGFMKEGKLRGKESFEDKVQALIHEAIKQDRKLMKNDGVHSTGKLKFFKKKGSKNKVSNNNLPVSNSNNQRIESIARRHDATSNRLQAVEIQTQIKNEILAKEVEELKKEVKTLKAQPPAPIIPAPIDNLPFPLSKLIQICMQVTTSEEEQEKISQLEREIAQLKKAKENKTVSQAEIELVAQKRDQDPLVPPPPSPGKIDSRRSINSEDVKNARVDKVNYQEHLNAIRAGIALKPVSKENTPQRSIEVTIKQGNDLHSVLSRALDQRRLLGNFDLNDNDNNDSKEADWSDSDDNNTNMSKGLSY